MLASEHWKDNPAPKFNTPQMKSALAKFAEQIAPQCAMPEIGFTVDGIVKHVQCFFNEQQRYRNRKPVDLKVHIQYTVLHFLLLVFNPLPGIARPQ